MSLRDSNQSLNTSMASKNNSDSQEIQGWKLDINHDGVILNWYPSPSDPKLISKDSPSDPKLISKDSPSDPKPNPKSKTNLFDYFDVVSDGVIFSGHTEM
jgi:hypothetical protein